MTVDTNPALDALRAAATASRRASDVLARSTAAERDRALAAMAAALRRREAAILGANDADLAAFDAAGAVAFRDRLLLTPARVEAMAQGLEDSPRCRTRWRAALADWTRPNGLRIRRVAAPIGVIGMIYESRPNVGADAAGCA